MTQSNTPDQKNQRNYWIRSILFTVGQRVSMLLFGFGSFALMADYLEKPEFGVWGIFLVTVNILEVARTGLIKSPLIKYLNDADHREHPFIQTASFVINFVLAGALVLILLSLGGAFSSLLGSPRAAPLFEIYAFSSVLLTLFYQFEFIQQARMSFSGVFWSYFFRQGTMFGLTALLVFGNLGIEDNLNYLIWAYTISAGVGTLVSLFFTIKHLSLSKQIKMNWVRQLIGFGKYSFATNISSIILRATDVFMLNRFLGEATQASYNVTVRIANLVEIPSQAISDVVLPKSVESMAKEGNKGVKELYEKSVGILLGVMVPAVLSVQLLSEFLLTIIGDGKYLDAAPVLQLTVLYSLFLPFMRQWANVCDSIHKPEWNFYVVLGSTIFNAMLNYLFISPDFFSLGIKGAAYATLTTYVSVVVVNQIILKRAIGVRLGATFRHFFIPYQFFLVKLKILSPKS